MKKKFTRGGIGSSDTQVKLDELATLRASDNPYWVALTSHRVSVEMMQMLETIYNLYGKAGDDSIWVASWDEIYEYVQARLSGGYPENRVWKHDHVQNNYSFR